MSIENLPDGVFSRNGRIAAQGVAITLSVVPDVEVSPRADVLVQMDLSRALHIHKVVTETHPEDSLKRLPIVTHGSLSLFA